MKKGRPLDYYLVFLLLVRLTITYLFEFGCGGPGVKIFFVHLQGSLMIMLLIFQMAGRIVDGMEGDDMKNLISFWVKDIWKICELCNCQHISCFYVLKAAEKRNFKIWWESLCQKVAFQHKILIKTIESIWNAKLLTRIETFSAWICIYMRKNNKSHASLSSNPYFIHFIKIKAQL